jgi:hypothetical protein
MTSWEDPKVTPLIGTPMWSVVRDYLAVQRYDAVLMLEDRQYGESTSDLIVEAYSELEDLRHRDVVFGYLTVDKAYVPLKQEKEVTDLIDRLIMRLSPNCEVVTTRST